MSGSITYTNGHQVIAREKTRKEYVMWCYRTRISLRENRLERYIRDYEHLYNFAFYKYLQCIYINIYKSVVWYWRRCNCTHICYRTLNKVKIVFRFLVKSIVVVGSIVGCIISEFYLWNQIRCLTLVERIWNKRYATKCRWTSFPLGKFRTCIDSTTKSRFTILSRF